MDLRRVAAVQFARVLADLGTAALALPTLGLTFYRLRCAYDAAQEKEVRKAEKKKCEYCKRFSCIC